MKLLVRGDVDNGAERKTPKFTESNIQERINKLKVEKHGSKSSLDQLSERSQARSSSRHVSFAGEVPQIAVKEPKKSDIQVPVLGKDCSEFDSSIKLSERSIKHDKNG